MSRVKTVGSALLALGLLFLTTGSAAESGEAGKRARAALAETGVRKGICAVLGLPDGGQPGFVTDLAKGSELLVYFQSPDEKEALAVSRAAVPLRKTYGSLTGWS